MGDIPRMLTDQNSGIALFNDPVIRYTYMGETFKPLLTI